MSGSIRAMVLAAGVGSRLAPLTDKIPKPLVKIGGKPIMEHILLLLKKHGITDVVSNTHHLADTIHDYFRDFDKQGVNLKFVYEKNLSGVAGGIRSCKDFLKDHTSCIVMGDALTDIDLTMLYQAHLKAVKEHDCIATVAMMQIEDTSHFGVIVTESMLDGNTESPSANRIVKFQEKPKSEDALSNWANTGVYFFEPEIFDFIPGKEKAAFYDVAKDLFPKLLTQEKYIQAIPVAKTTYWADLGTPKQYFQSVRDVYENKIKLDSISINPRPFKSGKNLKLVGCNEIGKNVSVGDNVTIENSVIYDNVNIGDNVSIINSIIAYDAVIDGGRSIVDCIEDCQSLTASGNGKK